MLIFFQSHQALTVRFIQRAYCGLAQIPSGLTKEVVKHNWHIGLTHNLHIYLRNNTSQA